MNAERLQEIRARHKECQTIWRDGGYCTGCVLLAEIDALTRREENWEGILASELAATRELWDELGLTAEQFERARTNSQDATLEAIRELKAANTRLAADVERLKVELAARG